MATSFNTQRFERAATVGVNPFGKRLGEYKHWRDELVELITEYQTWIESQGLSTGEDDLRIYELIENLKSDKLTVAMVAEFSRGKTELINAIFFADYKQRLLPSEAGRTTMCPTELLYDEKQPPSLRLLPIESRKNVQSIAELKRAPIQWTTLPLDVDSPKQMSETFQEMVRTKAVTVHEAEELGLYNPGAIGVGPTLNADGRIEIPVWRHAVINFPHPLLKQGLVVLDTPGLNSLGTEPELTMSMLPKAQAVLFLLAADTGVTKSDLEVWTSHVCVAKRARDGGRFAVLNKVDTLWDDLRSDDSYRATLARMIHETAHALGIAPSQIFPVSAQKGLIAKIRDDNTLLTRSGLPTLESHISSDIIATKQQLLREKITREIGNIVETTSAMIEARLTSVTTQLGELRTLSGKNQNVIQQMLTRMRQEKAAYDKTLASFQTTRVVLNDQIKVMVDYLSMDAFDALIAKSRQDMKDSWTTHGLRVGMRVLFEGMVEAMDKANTQSQQIRGLVQAIYNKFHTDHGLANIRPASFALQNFRAQLQRLHDEAEAYRNSPAMVMTEAHFVIKRFFITLVSRTRELFSECNAAARAWAKAVMAPILSQVREHKILLDRRLEDLKKIHENLDNLSSRIAELESTRENLETQLRVIRQMRTKISAPVSLNS
jgi:Dynamin family